MVAAVVIGAGACDASPVPVFKSRLVYNGPRIGDLHVPDQTGSQHSAIRFFYFTKSATDELPYNFLISLLWASNGIPIGGRGICRPVFKRRNAYDDNDIKRRFAKTTKQPDQIS